MKSTLFRRLPLVAVVLIFALAITSNLTLLAQSRRQPLTSNQKKNKRPDGTQIGGRQQAGDQ